MRLPTEDEPAVLVQGDAGAALRGLPDGCVQTCCTSPPYYGLRDYGTGEWEGGDPACDHRETTAMRQAKSRASSTLGGSRETCHGSHVAKAECGKCGARRLDRQVGLEDSPAGYADRLVEVFREVRRVLHSTGTVWLNLGDSYTSGGRTYRDPGQSKLHPAFTGDHTAATRWRPADPPGLKPKDLMGVPWRLAFALQADGWYLRAGLPWVKRNSMPESVTDRPANALEYVFLLSKSERYFYDAAAVRVGALQPEGVPARTGQHKSEVFNHGGTLGTNQGATTRNRRNTDPFFESWQGLYDDGDPLAFIVNPVPSDFAHFAMWPPKLVEPMVRAGTSEKGCCPTCRAPWRRQTVRDRKPTRPGKAVKYLPKSDGDAATAETAGWNRPNVIGNRDPQRHCTLIQTTGWEPGCKCPAHEPAPCIVLDPFCGSGTTGAVAAQLGRLFVGIDLNPEYLELARKRLAEPVGVGGLFGPKEIPVMADLFEGA